MTTRPALGALDPNAARQERWIAAALLAITFLFAVIVQTLLFHRSSAMGGDIDYHRGVGLTMSAGMWRGEGPVHGLLSYFGGLYPMTFGWGSRALGVSFDSLLSVVSWPMVLALPLALLWLGRRLWPERALEPAMFVFLGTVGSSLALDTHAEWVYSLLPSGANLWPTYPRDIALVLLVVALAIVVGSESHKATALAGLVAGFSICVHAQLGVYTVAMVIAYRLWQAVPARAFRRWIGDAAIVAAVAFGISSWWWWPRLNVVLDTGTLVLKSYPGLTDPDASLAGLVGALGVVGVLAIPGLVLALRHGSQAVRFAAVWLLVIAPIGLVGALVGDVGVITGRRIFFLAAVPIVVCAADAATALVRRGPAAVVLPLLVLVIVIPSAAEASQTRDLVSLRWVTGPADAGWQPVYDQLRSRVLERGHETVIAPDADGARIWEHTGAQPFSFWPTGATKLGFDLGQLTPYSYKERVRMQDEAFAKGVPGICALARRVDAGSVVLFNDGALLGTHDVHPAGRFRVDPADRTRASLRRRVAPGTTYVDLNASDNLELAKGAEIVLDWDAPNIERVEVDRREWVHGPNTVSLVKPDGTIIGGEPGANSVATFITPGGITPGTRIVFREPTTLMRVIGFERVPGLADTGVTRGPTHFERDALCRRAA